MTSSAEPADAGTAAGASLLAPGWAGSPAASATGDRAYLRALLDAEV
ncbi:3-carboxy-cis,cis-muconate cycloisomerase, partial [Streptomyces coelicoflavus]|nr:3-carboxy-cis,cis-muconate cycloisomerase [Streptomyces coelicoflavus]